MSKHHEMVSIFKSYEWLIKDKLTSIDNMTRTMQQEMATFGVNKGEAREYLPEQFKRIADEVAEEQYTRYDHKEETG